MGELIFMWLVFLVTVLFTAVPVISVMIAGWIARSHGCELHGSFVNPCIVEGEDMGDTFYQTFVMGWFGLVTIPTGLIALAVWAGVAIALFVTGWPYAAPPVA